MNAKHVIAIDGPSGVGKSTVARNVAASLGYILIDTGALYRSLAWLANQDKISWEKGEAIASLTNKYNFSFTDDGQLLIDGTPIGDRIRTPLISKGASIVSKHKPVREALLSLQRHLGKDGGVVLEGRDIGTIVFPKAEYKFFLTASAEVRAKRRFDELTAKGVSIEYTQVLFEQIERDKADSTRKIAPLKQAPDAIEVKSDKLTAEQVAEHMLSVIRTNTI